MSTELIPSKILLRKSGTEGAMSGGNSRRIEENFRSKDFDQSEERILSINDETVGKP